MSGWDLYINYRIGSPIDMQQDKTDSNSKSNDNNSVSLDGNEEIGQTRHSEEHNGEVERQWGQRESDSDVGRVMRGSPVVVWIRDVDVEAGFGQGQEGKQDR